MNRQQESLKHKKSVAGNRSLRAHKRDVERKIHRDETLSRHRKLSAMSPLKEKVSNLKQDVTENRRQMLQKWKAERELKKKLQQREQGKKPMFRVTHVVPETVPFDKPLPKRVTRASVAAAKRSTRSSNISEKVSVPPVATKRPATRATKRKTTQAAAPASRSGRSRGSASIPVITATSKPPPPARSTKRSSSKRTDTRHVTQARGESTTSFAPDNFKFAPPENLSQVVINPLSPVSAQCFMFTAFDMTTDSRRCSTPKVVLKRVSTPHPPPVSVIRPVRRSGQTPVDKDTSGENIVSPKEVASGDENMPPPISTSVIRTPGRAPRQRRHTAADVPASSGSSKKTPKCSSLILQHLSPEERVDVLLHSPMVEIRRRTPKVHRTPVMTVELPNFDDLDLSIAADINTTVDAGKLPATEATPGDTAVTGSDMTANGSDMTANGSDMAANGSDMAATGSDTAVTGNDAAATGSDTADLVVKVKSDDDLLPEHDVSYFRQLLVSEAKRLTTVSEKWNEINTSTDHLSEEVEGQIRTTVGQAQLLMKQRFKQFSGLIDNCEFGTGEKATLCTDLQGFWDMIYFQVEDVDNKFAELSKLRSNNWVKEQKQQPKNKKVSKKPAVKKPVVRSKVGTFLAKMKQQKTAVGAEEQQKTAVGAEEQQKTAVGTEEQQKTAVKKPVVRSKFGTFLAKMKQQKTAVGSEEQEKTAVGAEEQEKTAVGAEEQEKTAVGAEEQEKTAVGAEEQQKTAVVAEEQQNTAVVAEEQQNTAVVAEEETGRDIDGVVVTEEAMKEDNTIVGKEEDGGSGVENCDPVGTETDTKIKTFDGGFFTVNSPVHSPVLQQKCGSSAKKSLSRSGSKNSSRANTPRGSCNSKSLLLMSVMKRLSRSAQRCSSSPQLSGGETSPRSIAITPSGGSTGRRQRSRRSLAVCVAPDTPSVFSPRDTDMIDSCVDGVETNPAPDCYVESSLSKYLVPTKVQEEESMDVDMPAISADVDMSSQMKRNLSAEFDRQSLSRERRSSRSAVDTPKQHKSAVKRRRSSTQASGQRRTRRSVRFVDASDSPTCERMPVTPFNKDSRVPRKRSTSHSDKTSPTLPGTAVEASDSDTPVHRLAQLTVKHTPTGRTATPITKMPNLTEIDEEETCERPLLIRDDLMSFSPVFMTTPVKKLSTAPRTPNRTPRRSTRLSLL